MTTTIVGDMVRRVRDLMKEYDEVLDPKESVCSQNTKTGHSVNLPHIVCRPTPVCGNVCYGAMKGKPITWDNSLKKYIRVYRYLLSSPPEEAADRIHDEYIRRKMTFLR